MVGWWIRLPYTLRLVKVGHSGNPAAEINKGMDKLEGRLFISFAFNAAILAYIALK